MGELFTSREPLYDLENLCSSIFIYACLKMKCTLKSCKIDYIFHMKNVLKFSPMFSTFANLSVLIITLSKPIYCAKVNLELANPDLKELVKQKKKKKSFQSFLQFVYKKFFFPV